MGRHYEDVMRELVDAIVGGEYAEGAWLPSVDDLQTRLGAGRGVVREALRALEERGLIVVHAGRGHRIRSHEDWDLRDATVLRAWIARGPDPYLLSETIAARALLEREAARVVCSRMAGDLALLRGFLERMEWALAPDVERTLERDDPFVAAEIAFHRTLLDLSENRMLATMIDPVHAVLAQLRRARAPERDVTALTHHSRILEGLLSRDPALADAAIWGYARQLGGWVGARRR
jgi:DNA-binding FadR family transcriptional regulator